MQATGFLIPPDARELRRPQNLPLLLLVTAWTVAYFAGIVSHNQTGANLAAMALVTAGGVIAVRLVRRSSASPLFRMVAAWMALGVAALFLMSVVTVVWYLAFVVPVLLTVIYLGLRRPEYALGAVLIFTGIHGTITAYTPIKVGVISDGLLIGLYIAILIRYALGTNRQRVSFPPAMLVFGAFALISIFQLIGSFTANGLLSFRFSTWYMLGIFFVGYANWDELLVRRVVRIMVFTGCLVGSYAVLRKIIGDGDREIAQTVAGLGAYNHIGSEQKLLGSFTSAAELAQWMSMTAPMLAALAFGLTGRWRAVAGIGAVMCLIAETAADSRTGLAAVGIGLAVIPAGFMFARAYPRFGVGTMLALIGVSLTVGTGAYLAVTANSPERRTHYAGLLRPGKDFSYAERRLKWSNAMSEIKTHPLGHGFGSAGRIGQQSGFIGIDTTNVDNSYLLIALQQGFLVMGLFIAALVAMILNLLALAVRTANRLAAALAIGAAGSLVAFGVMMYTGSYVEGTVALWGWLMAGLAFSQLVVASGLRRSPLDEPADRRDRAAPVVGAPPLAVR